MPGSIKHFVYVPFTGLGLYKGFRGNAWLKNRIQIFKQFVIPSLLNQTNKNFSLWISWRPEEKYNTLVNDFQKYLDTAELETIHTFGGVCFWDDKYPDIIAQERLATSLHTSIQTLVNHTDAEEVIMTIQPSDDCYWQQAIDNIQKTLAAKEIQATGYLQGYIMNYATGEVAEYNPLTIPPFFSIKFPRSIFIDPLKHLRYTGPYKSHEYIAQKLKFQKLEDRGFLVGTHGENISTIYNHPFKGKTIIGDEEKEIIKNFGLWGIPLLKIKYPLWKKVYKKFPHRMQRKLRYIFGEKFWAKLHG